jgi:hypothetical protein
MWDAQAKLASVSHAIGCNEHRVVRASALLNVSIPKEDGGRGELAFTQCFPPDTLDELDCRVEEVSLQDSESGRHRRVWVVMGGLATAFEIYCMSRGVDSATCPAGFLFR